ncbi:MAG: cytochrome c [Pseudomonadota bacterium]
MKKTMLALAAASLISAGSVMAADPVAGKTKFETCLGCHGINKWVNAYPTFLVPKLAGQHADYLVAALKAYREGARPHATMHANAAQLSDEDIADIAAFLSELKP